MKNILLLIFFTTGCVEQTPWTCSQYDYGNIYFENAVVVSIEYTRCFTLFESLKYDVIFEWKYGKFYLYKTHLYPNEISEGYCVVIKYQEIFKKYDRVIL